MSWLKDQFDDMERAEREERARIDSVFPVPQPCTLYILDRKILTDEPGTKTMPSHPTPQ